MPDNRSFLDIVNGGRAPLHGVPDMPSRAARDVVARLRAVAVSPPTAVTVCTGVAILGLCAAIYGTSSSLHDRPLAGIARDAGEAAARGAAASQPQPALASEPSTEGVRLGAPSLAAPEPDSADRSPSLITALAPIDPLLRDPQLTNDISVLRADDIGQSGGSLAKLWARIGPRDAEDRLNRLSAAYDELSAERDRLRERVKELEQALSLLQAPPPQAAKAPDSVIGAGAPKTGVAVVAFPSGETAGASADQSRPVLKNFTTPGTVPNYFTDESGAVLGNHAAAPVR